MDLIERIIRVSMFMVFQHGGLNSNIMLMVVNVKCY